VGGRDVPGNPPPGPSGGTDLHPGRRPRPVATRGSGLHLLGWGAGVHVLHPRRPVPARRNAGQRAPRRPRALPGRAGPARRRAAGLGGLQPPPPGRGVAPAGLRRGVGALPAHDPPPRGQRLPLRLPRPPVAGCAGRVVQSGTGLRRPPLDPPGVAGYGHFTGTSPEADMAGRSPVDPAGVSRGPPVAPGRGRARRAPAPGRAGWGRGGEGGRADPLVLPLDKPEVWTLHFRYKPPRIEPLEYLDKTGNRVKKPVWYLWYQVYNMSGEPQTFLPEFELVTKDL